LERGTYRAHSDRVRLRLRKALEDGGIEFLEDDWGIIGCRVRESALPRRFGIDLTTPQIPT
jgi:hypothetical protein